MKLRTRILAPLAALGLAVFLTAAISRDQSTLAIDAETEANITRVMVRLLATSQFANHTLDNELAGMFLDRYLDALDGERMLFVQADLAEFAPYRATLARDTLRKGDTTVAHLVFHRYLQRLGQRVAYVDDMLRTATFDFSGDGSYAPDRKHTDRPLDLASAREIWWQRLRFEYLQEKLEGKRPEAIAATLEKRSNRLLRTMRQTSRDEVLEIYLSALAQVYDPHSDYLGHQQMSEFAISMNLSLFGIGATLQSIDGYCRIVDLVPGGPAMRSGLLGPGDRIVAVAQGGEEPIDVVEMPLSRIVQLIRGPKGSVVSLAVLPASEGEAALRKTVRLVRDEIKLEEQRAKAKIVDFPHGQGSTLRLGVIDLPSFYSGTGETSATADVVRLLEKLKKEHVQGVILDLRRNGGGSLEESIKLTGLFITEGPVVQTRGPNGDIDIGVDTDPTEQYAGPLLVLTSRYSASASEILAGALQDYGRAIIVGDASTFGKGTVQSVISLAPIMDRSGLDYTYDPGALTVTIRKFYRPSGSSTQLKGVVPDIVLPSLSGMSRIDESALDNPLPWDSVPAAGYQRESALHPYLARLRATSARRVSETEEFAYLRAEIARLKDRLATKTVSLNEAVRRQEIARFEQRKKEHEMAIKALQVKAPVTYEITVGDADRPGLPQPSVATDEPAAAGASDPGGGTGDRALNPLSSLHDDPILREAEKILLDYMTLRGRDLDRGTRQAQVVGARDSRLQNAGVAAP